MSVTALDHIYVETRNFEQTLTFWKTLGFAIESRWGDKGHRACRLTAGSAAVVLAEADPAGNPERPTVHLAMADPAALAQKLAAEPNVEVVTPLEDTHWGTRWIRVQDPDGNLYCLEAPKDRP